MKTPSAALEPQPALLPLCLSILSWFCSSPWVPAGHQAPALGSAGVQERSTGCPRFLHVPSTLLCITRRKEPEAVLGTNKCSCFINSSEGITLAAPLTLSNDGVDPVTELADTSVHGRRVDVAVGGSPGDDANQRPAVPTLVYQRSAGITLQRRFLLSAPGTCSKLVPATWSPVHSQVL